MNSLSPISGPARRSLFLSSFSACLPQQFYISSRCRRQEIVRPHLFLLTPDHGLGLPFSAKSSPPPALFSGFIVCCRSIGLVTLMGQHPERLSCSMDWIIGVEHSPAFLPECHHRIRWPPGSKADALAELIHSVDMVPSIWNPPSRRTTPSASRMLTPSPSDLTFPFRQGTPWRCQDHLPRLFGVQPAQLHSFKEGNAPRRNEIAEGCLEALQLPIPQDTYWPGNAGQSCRDRRFYHAPDALSLSRRPEEPAAAGHK